MKLLGSPGSPYVRKVRIVLEEKRMAYEYVVARPSAPDSPVPQYNPLGKIPVLVRDDGRPLYDSSVIVDYVDAVGPQPKLIPDALEDRIEVKRWEALGDGVAEAAVLISHDYRKPKDKWESADWHRKHRLKIERGVEAMARDLRDKPHCHGEGYTLADIASCYALHYLDYALPEVEWR
ncbi:MAG: glutathione S-transferase N-terminal domain-containing protein [Methanocella sp.]